MNLRLIIKNLQKLEWLCGRVEDVHEWNFLQDNYPEVMTENPSAFVLSNKARYVTVIITLNKIGIEEISVYMKEVNETILNLASEPKIESIDFEGETLLPFDETRFLLKLEYHANKVSK